MMLMKRTTRRWVSGVRPLAGGAAAAKERPPVLLLTLHSIFTNQAVTQFLSLVSNMHGALIMQQLNTGTRSFVSFVGLFRTLRRVTTLCWCLRCLVIERQGHSVKTAVVFCHSSLRCFTFINNKKGCFLRSFQNKITKSQTHSQGNVYMREES